LNVEDFHTVYLGLGANLGQKEQTLAHAIEEIGEQVGIVDARSALYYSEPWGFRSEHQFVNAVVRVFTTLSPFQLLNVTQRIERLLGKRGRHHSLKVPSDTSSSSGQRPQYHDRPIDIDILLYDDIKVETAELTIPHPLMHERPFVMEPLKEIMKRKNY
jgi:2-amino-4-hydroxy-6-hydroxymethyldihydropteridine diphosphokinase